MEVLTSPQQIAVGEGNQLISEKNHVCIQSYASKLNGQKVVPTLDLCPITMEQGIPTVEFSVDEVNAFTREEGLHHAVIFKFSYGKPELQDLRRLLPKHFDVKGMCNTGQLEYRHILVRFDLFEDFANVVSKSSGYIKSKGEDFFFRTFPWTMDFNPREETSKVVTWISFLELPANFFAKKSIMSIASVVGKPIAIDKATQDRTRPSMARVKILINLLDKLPKKVKLKIVDKDSGRIVEYDQRIVFDNLPKFCTCCHHQGHDVYSCRWKLDEETEQASQSVEQEKHNSLGKLRGDARDFSNANNASRRMEESLPSRADPPIQSDSELHLTKAKSIVQVSQPKISSSVVKLDGIKKLQGDARNLLIRKRDAQGKVVHSQGHQVNAVWKQKVISQGNSDPAQLVESVTIHNDDMLSKRVEQAVIPNTPMDVVQQRKSPSPDLLQSKCENSAYFSEPSEALKSVTVPLKDSDPQLCDQDGPHIRCNLLNADRGKALIIDIDNNVDDSVLDSEQKAKGTATLKSISKKVFEHSITNSTTEVGSVSGDKAANANPNTFIRGVWKPSFPTAHCHHTTLNAKSQFGIPNDQKVGEVGYQQCGTEIATNLNRVAQPTDSNFQQNASSLQSQKSNSQQLQATVPLILNAAEIKTPDLVPDQATNTASIAAENPTIFLAPDLASNLATQAVCEEDSLLGNREILQDKNRSDELQTSNDAVLQKADVNPSSRTSRNDSSRNNNKQNSKKSSEITSSSNSFVALAIFDNQEDKMMGGVIKKIQSYTPMSISSAYSGDDLNDNDEISSLEGNSKQIIVANMRDMVIKSKLWDQHFSEDDESLDEHQDECNNQEEECDDSNKATVIKNNAEKFGIGNQSYSGSKLNHNAKAYCPIKDTAPPISAINGLSSENKLVAVVKSSQNQQLATPTVEKQLLQEKEMPNPILQGRHVYDEREEEDFLKQRRVEASIKGDLSPMHSTRKKKPHQIEKSWDGKAGEDVIIRKLPMRIAKQKQIVQHSVLKPTRQRNKRNN